MPHPAIEPLEIQLESSEIVLRGFTGEELDPAVLNGELVLHLLEPTNLKEVQLTFTGTAKVTWRDSSTHHHDHPLFFHDFNFLNPTPPTPGGAKAAPHVHTLQAGRHVFPFSLHIPGSLPATLRTYSGTCVVEYKLKAIATRPGFGADWKARKVVKIARGFGVDAVEYNQTLEIENTWPGKVMYAFTIPHKAYAAGETIPVSVKFSPLAKGVQIASLITTIREHTTVHSKSSSHSEARDATVVKYNFVPDGSVSPPLNTHPPPRISSSASLSSMIATPSPQTPGLGMSAHGARPGPGEASGSGSVNASGGFPGFSTFGRHEGEEEEPEREERGDDDDLDVDTEVDVVVDVPIPIWTAPSHSVHPVFINHKIKWSAFIRNPDGHVSELRCALPIHILAPCLAEEARLASAGARNLLFGDSGVLAHSDIPQVDLPSYQDHVMDRVANAETASYFAHSAGFAPTPWSTLASPVSTPGEGTPPGSRPPSPGALARERASSFSLAGFNTAASRQPIPASRLASRRSSGSITPVSPPSEPFDEEHPEDHRNWIDSELLSSLQLDTLSSPPGSNPPSRPPSRGPSRPPSRASSPTPEHRHEPEPEPPAHSSSPSIAESYQPPPIARSTTSSSTSGSSTGGGGFFHLHIPKPLRPLTAFSRTGSSSSLMNAVTGHAHAHQPSASALSNALEAHAAKGGSTTPDRHGHVLETITHSTMSNSPDRSGPSTPVSSSPTTTLQAPSTSSNGAPSHLMHAHLTSCGPQTSSGSGSAPSTPVFATDDPDVDFLSQVPSYDVAARGFLGGGVVPLSTTGPRLPNYED